MTQFRLLPTAPEPEKKPLKAGTENGQNQMEQMEKGVETSGNKEGGKLNFLLIWTAPFPIYFFIFFIFTFDKCLQMFDPVHVTLLLGGIASFELLNVILFCPPRYAKNMDLEVMDFKRTTVTDFNNKKNTPLQYVHFLCTLVSLWLFVDVGIAYMCRFIPREYYFYASFAATLPASFATFTIYKALKDKVWMNGFNHATTVNSIFFQLLGCFCLLLSLITPGDRFTPLAIGCFIFLGVVANLRFVYNFENPPKTKCMLTLVHTRKLVGQSFRWVAIMNAALWCSLLLLVLLPSSSPNTERRPMCVQMTTSVLMIFCVSVPIMMIFNFIMGCIISCARKTFVRDAECNTEM